SAMGSLAGGQELVSPESISPADDMPSAPDRPVEDRRQRFVEVLALADWDESRLSKFADRQPLSVDEQLEIWRFIDRLTTLDPLWMHRRYAHEVTPHELVEAPGKYRGQVIRLRGNARKVEIEEPNPEDRKR